MNRRDFVGLSLAVVGSIFVPKYGRWFSRKRGVPLKPQAIEAPIGSVYLEAWRCEADGTPGTWVKVESGLWEPLRTAPYVRVATS